MQIHFLSNVLIGVAPLDLKVPNNFISATHLRVKFLWTSVPFLSSLVPDSDVRKKWSEMA